MQSGWCTREEGVDFCGVHEYPSSKVFRARAKECREIAGLCQSENPRNLVLEVADKYDRLADQAASMELQQADKIS